MGGVLESCPLKRDGFWSGLLANTGDHRYSQVRTAAGQHECAGSEAVPVPARIVPRWRI